MELATAALPAAPPSSTRQLAAMLLALTVRDAAKLTAALEAQGIAAADVALIDALLAAADDLAKPPAPDPSLAPTPSGFAPPIAAQSGVTGFFGNLMSTTATTGV